MAETPKKYGVVLYEGFQLIDVCGPIDVLNVLTTHAEGISLSVISESLQPTSTFPKTWPDKMGMPPFTTSQLITPTHTFETAPQLDVLIIPGGMGCFDPDPNNAGQPNPTVVNPIIKFIQKAVPWPQVPCDRVYWVRYHLTIRASRWQESNDVQRGLEGDSCLASSSRMGSKCSMGSRRKHLDVFRGVLGN
ncbi:hypothetical protein CEP52_010742 [Fusarium oligoseptatum]|uniref:DJ-1/PfpI domain-containing protein n=1 Tax=Fusarium oligoseptatum TaxID=2604345 RepID=A0A428T731_9HYPO|nr:hypothetical protein CEP52_010742 [Fusarium oligoseptatum]